MRLAIILYSYHKRLDRQRELAKLSYQSLAACPGVEVFITSRAGHDDEEPGCFRRMPLDAPEGYEFLPDKTLAMLRWLVEHAEFDYLLKCDDDLYLDTAAVRRLMAATNLPDYIGSDVKTLQATRFGYHRGRCVTPELNETDVDTSWAVGGMRLATGTCYGLSAKAVRELLAAVERTGFSTVAARARRDIRGVGAEDWLVAWLLRECGIHPVQSLRVINGGCGRQLAKGVMQEVLVRTRLRTAAEPCIGVYAHNRMPRPAERAMIASWFRLSALLPSERAVARPVTPG